MTPCSDMASYSGLGCLIHLSDGQLSFYTSARHPHSYDHGTGSCDEGVVEDGDREAVEGGVVDDSMF